MTLQALRIPFSINGQQTLAPSICRAINSAVSSRILRFFCVTPFFVFYTSNVSFGTKSLTTHKYLIALYRSQIVFYPKLFDAYDSIRRCLQGFSRHVPYIWPLLLLHTGCFKTVAFFHTDVNNAQCSWKWSLVFHRCPKGGSMQNCRLPVYLYVYRIFHCTRNARASVAQW